MTLDELLLEWSYRSEKGYPSLDNPSDISVLKQILEKIDIPSDTIIRKIKEAPIKSATLGKRKNDVRFLDKINKGDTFEMEDGSKIIIDPKQSAESIQKIQNQDYANLTFTDTSGKTHKLTKFKKTPEFGGKIDDTKIMESAHCYALAIAYYVKQGPIDEDDLLGATSSEQFAQAAQYVDVDAELDEIEEFFDRKEAWYLSIVKATNKIYELFPNKNYTIHRNSETVEMLYNAFRFSLEKKVDKSLDFSDMKDDKWNPADIWLINDKVDPEEFSGNVEVLNGQIADLYEDGDMVGISLKMISKKNPAIEKVYNDPGVDPETYTYEGYKTTIGSAGADIIFTGGSATARMFQTTKGFAVEIKGIAAQGGKAGLGAVNNVLKRNGLTPLPSDIQKELDAFEANSEGHYNKLYYLIDRFVPGGISKENFKKTYESSDLAWKIGNYYSLELIQRLEDNQPEPTNEILDDIIRYAYSTTKDSSKFVKISG
jgi:hypothetical protein